MIPGSSNLMKKQGYPVADENFPGDEEVFVDNAGDIVHLVGKIASWGDGDRVVSICSVSTVYCEV